jgi:hypothetical protein
MIYAEIFCFSDATVRNLSFATMLHCVNPVYADSKLLLVDKVACFCEIKK